MTTSEAARRPVPWQLGVAALAIGVGIFFLLRAGDDFNQWVITLMWFAVGIYWIIDWRRDVKKRRRLQARAAAASEGSSAEAPREPGAL